ncbi:MAG: HIT family protein [Patescibacteria group bacterium]
MCIFCKIINQEIPCYRVYEDDKVLAFLDIEPVNPGHILVLPKIHYQNFEDINETDLSALILTVKKIGKLLKDKLGVDGYNVHENNNPIAGQEIPHLHFHIIPRYAGDGLGHWPGKSYQPGEAEEIIKKLKN